uniref:HtrA protease/chaperone protein n=1 Tax=uncultured Armatimonadetes bacterium TaxID=157466 RepID=A0A6J4IV19_9BACT|nr:HtrA protease/chaperone protein [uncultured Armatimonadetes bacterium]
MKKLIGYVLVFVLGFGACALILQSTGAGVYNAGATSRGRETISEALAQPARPTPSVSNASAVADAAARVEPAVVNIDIEGRRNAVVPFGVLPDNYTFQGSGSGIILSGDGYVVTNNHVIEPVASRRGGRITITLDNGKTFNSVEIVGRDPRSDLAVLKINGARNLAAARLGDSDRLRVGDWAIAVGNPLGFNSTVTLGIVSALNRRGFRVESGALDRVIQTDAAINPGNSGGALADISGQVVGINTAIASSTGASVGIGFAIPINQARRIINQLVKSGEVVRPYLGIVYSPLSLVERDGLPPGVVLPDDNQGALIFPQRDQAAIVPGSPAAKAGLRPYDVIREIDGRRVENVDIVKDVIQEKQVGDKIRMTIWRAGRTLEVTVTLERMPRNFASPQQQP